MIVEAIKLGADDYITKGKTLEEVERQAEKLLLAVTARRARVGGDQRLLRVFLCHASQDKPAVRRIHARLKRDGFLPWLDEKQILAGQDWDLEIRRAVRDSDVLPTVWSVTW